MGLRGPAPKPTVLKIMEGNPGKRALNKYEPKPTLGAPACPTWLDAEAKAEWRRIVPELDRLGMLAKIDRSTIAAYCQAWAEFHSATTLLKKEGRVVQTSTGYKAPHPAISMQRTAWEAVKKFSALFGLDPSSRSRLAVDPSHKKPSVPARKRS